MPFETIPCSRITEVKPTQIDNVYYATYPQQDDTEIMLLLLGSNEECTTTLENEFVRTYLHPAHEDNNGVNQFRRYSKWLKKRNELIKGFTEYKGKRYMVADRRFSHYYSRYGFCTACGILRCSPVWCICGHKEVSNGWTSNNKKLDEFIKKTQLKTNSANDAYLEWIPFDCIYDRRDGCGYLEGLPIAINQMEVKLIPLEITDETDDSYYAEVTIYLCVMFVE